MSRRAPLHYRAVQSFINHLCPKVLAKYSKEEVQGIVDSLAWLSAPKPTRYIHKWLEEQKQDTLMMAGSSLNLRTVYKGKNG